MNLQHVPLVPLVTNINTYTLILDHPNGHNSLNAMYSVEPNQLAQEHVAIHMCKKTQKEYLHNVYDLPSVKPTIRYLHGAVGFPTKALWLKAICRGNYLSWSLINVKNVAKFFLASKETQKGHICSQRQGVRSTKVTEPTDNLPTTLPH